MGRLFLFLGLVITLVDIPAAAQSAYTPPPASASIVSGIPFQTGQPLDQKLHDRFAECDQHNICDGKPLTKYKCSTDPSRNSVFLKLGGKAVFYDAKMGVDADGSELSKTHPGETDQPATSLRYGLPGCPSVNADKVPYVVIPGGFAQSAGVELGDVAAVVYKDRVVYAIVADVGPTCKIGEGSIELHEKLEGPGHGCVKRDEQGVCMKPASNGVDKNVLYFIFPGSKAKICNGPGTGACKLSETKTCNGPTPENINDRITTEGQTLMNSLQQSH